MEILYLDNEILVCRKEAGLLSTDEPGGVPELLRRQLGDGGELRTVHRLDRVVGGLMVLARSAPAASALSRQIREGSFQKEYLAAAHGQTPEEGRLRDLLPYVCFLFLCHRQDQRFVCNIFCGQKLGRSL